MNVITKILTKAAKPRGDLSRMARECGITNQAYLRWMRLGRFPRTDFTGETDYAGTIARLTGNDRDRMLAASRKWWIKNAKDKQRK